MMNRHQVRARKDAAYQKNLQMACLKDFVTLHAQHADWSKTVQVVAFCPNSDPSNCPSMQTLACFCSCRYFGSRGQGGRRTRAKHSQWQRGKQPANGQAR